MLYIAREATHTNGIKNQSGIVVLRPHYVAFLPTRPGVHLAWGLALSLLPVQTDRGPRRDYDLDSLIDRGPGAFDREVCNQAALVWTPDETRLAVAKGVKPGKEVGVTWVREYGNCLHSHLPGHIPRELLQHWLLWTNPPPTRKQFARESWQLALVGVVPTPLALLLGYLAVTEPDPAKWFGVAFFLALPATLFVLSLHNWARIRRHEREQEDRLDIPRAAPKYALEAWPEMHHAVTGAELAPLSVAPKPPAFDLTLIYRALLSGLLDYLILTIAAVFGVVQLETLTGISLPFLVPLMLFSYHTLLVWKLGGLLGNRLLGLRVRTANGAPLTLKRAAGRVFGAYLLFGVLTLFSLFAFIGLIFYVRAKGALPHEIASGTRMEWA